MLSIAPTTEIKAYRTQVPEEDCLGTVVMVTRDHLNAATFMSFTHTDWSWIPSGKYVDRAIIQGNLLTGQRNESVQRMKGNWLMFIDDDMVWEPKQLGQLIQTRDEEDLDILGGLCFQRGSPHQPTLYMRESADAGMYNFLEKWDTDIVEVDATGMAFVVIHKRVFEKMTGSTMPPYEERLKYGPMPFFRWEGILGEDLRFCQDARKAGARIFVDTRIEIGHIAEVEIRHKHFLLETLSRSPELVAERTVANTKMGLPTLTSEEARALLATMK